MRATGGSLSKRKRSSLLRWSSAAALVGVFSFRQWRRDGVWHGLCIFLSLGPSGYSQPLAVGEKQKCVFLNQSRWAFVGRVCVLAA